MTPTTSATPFSFIPDISIFQANRKNTDFFVNIVMQTRDFRYLKYASPKILCKRKLVHALAPLIEEERLVLFSKDVPSKFKRIRRIIYPLIKKQPWEFKEFSDLNRNNPKLVEKFIFINHSVILFMGDTLKSDRSYIESLIRKNPWLIQYVPEQFKNDSELRELALSLNPEVAATVNEVYILRLTPRRKHFTLVHPLEQERIAKLALE